MKGTTIVGTLPNKAATGRRFSEVREAVSNIVQYEHDRTAKGKWIRLNKFYKTVNQATVSASYLRKVIAQDNGHADRLEMAVRTVDRKPRLYFRWN